LREVAASALAGQLQHADALAKRAALLLAGLGLAWTALVAGIVFGAWGIVVGLHVWLPLWASLAIVGAAVAAAAALILRGKRKRDAAAQAATATRPVRQWVERHPLESMLAAATAGLVVSQTPNLTPIVLRVVAERLIASSRNAPN